MNLLSLNVVSYLVNCFKMNSLLITLGISLSIIYCEAAILDYSNITPWRIAYAVYPIYDSEPWVDVWRNQRSPESWVQVWKNERSWDVFDDAIHVTFDMEHKNDNINLNKKAADLGDPHKNPLRPEKSADDSNSKSKQPSTYPWNRSDKDWAKNVKKDLHGPL